VIGRPQRSPIPKLAGELRVGRGETPDAPTGLGEPVGRRSDLKFPRRRFNRALTAHTPDMYRFDRVDIPQRRSLQRPATGRTSAETPSTLDRRALPAPTGWVNRVAPGPGAATPRRSYRRISDLPANGPAAVSTGEQNPPRLARAGEVRHGLAQPPIPAAHTGGPGILNRGA